MEQNSLISAVEMLKRVVIRAYPDRQDLISVPVEGSYAQVWNNLARIVAADDLTCTQALAPAFGVDAAPSLGAVNAIALRLIPFGTCQERGILPMGFVDDALIVGTSNPFDAETKERLQFISGKQIRFVLASPSVLNEGIFSAYSKEARREISMPGAIQLAGSHDVFTIDDVTDDNVIIKLSGALFLSAIEQRASDLHIQPYLGSNMVRVRVDGVLRRMTMLPDAVAATLIRHIKARAGMDPTNSLIPQDGRMSVISNGMDYDLRISVLPTNRGERLVVRFLDKNRVSYLRDAGFSLAAMQVLRRLIARPSGLVIFTGPTGSGKTSTLYSMLSELNRTAANIITVENPVEYQIPGISQVEVNDKSGRTFAASLRSILRQDPDVILIGEIRDQETAEIATQAALTGHLVLSTLHTCDALTAIPRLLDLGIQPSILGDSLVAVASQRLVRKLCPACKVPTIDPLSPEEQYFFDITRNRPAYRPVGCNQCDQTGYLGRLPVVDIVEINKDLRDAIVQGESQVSALQALRRGGLKSIAASSSGRIISGETTVSEAREVVGPGFWPELAQHHGLGEDNDACDLYQAPCATSQCVLLIGRDDCLTQALQAELDNAGFRLICTPSADGAFELLKANEDIVFIIGNLADDVSLDDAITALRNNRRKISWARLPSIVLMPVGLAAQVDALRESGVQAKFMEKTATISEMVGEIRYAQVR